ncbi:MAG TPA: hypothetical protein VGJ57_12330 [Nitrospirales bacterium]|jgi:hypothetical protein
MASNTLRPFYFTVIFWGDAHRRYFLDLLLASLLSPNNIPVLNPARKSKFLIVTTRSDWDALQSEPLFQQMTRYLEPVWFEMPFPQPDDLKMLVMSRGHKQVTMRAFADRAYGIFVTPDLVLSDGSVAAMQRLAEAGRKVVLSVAIRFAQETLLQELERQGYLKSGQSLVLPARDLMRIALQHLHTETLRYEFDAPYFADLPISVYWWVPEGHGMIIYSFSWAPLLVDYAALRDHDASTFDEWTMDGDYIHRNFPDPDDVYVCRDSDELVLVSFTKEADLHFDLTVDPRRRWWNRFAVSAKAQRIWDLRDSPIMDPLKRSIFQQPVYLHSTDLTPGWQDWQKHTEDILASASYPNNMPRHIERQFVSDVYTYSGTGGSRFSDWVVEWFADESSPNGFVWWLIILFWLVVIRPYRHVVTRTISGYFIFNWYWRYRRFVWWRAKVKLGWARETHYNWTDTHWAEPGVSLVCPVFTIRWLWSQCSWFMTECKQCGFDMKHVLGLLRAGHNSNPEK